MKKTVLFYGLALAFLAALLKSLEYRYFVRSLSLEVYMGALATVFTVLGVWIGLKFTHRGNPGLQASPVSPGTEAISQPPPVPTNRPAPDTFRISNRELEVLGLMAQGHSNQEIADALFVSLATVKTHTSNLYAKLDVKRRTQAVQKAKKLNIIA